MTTGKTIALARWIFVDKVISLLFNMLSRLVIAFLPRSKHLLISWWQSTSAVILEPPPKKSLTLFPLFPHLFPMKWWQVRWSGIPISLRIFHRDTIIKFLSIHILIYKRRVGPQGRSIPLVERNAHERNKEQWSALWGGWSNTWRSRIWGPERRKDRCELYRETFQRDFLKVLLQDAW